MPPNEHLQSKDTCVIEKGDVVYSYRIEEKSSFTFTLRFYYRLPPRDTCKEKTLAFIEKGDVV